LEEIRAADWGEDGLLGPSTLNIGKLEAGVAMNVFAERASATLLHRIVDDMKRRKAQVLEIVRDRAEVTYLTQAEPQRMHVVDGFKTKVVSFGTDIPYLREMGTPLLIGPGSILDAHTEDEKITIQQMNEAVEIYKRLYFTLKEEA
ncbi:MAG: peptidase dimerization protein, partial [Ectothiorhodospiraceae bacterium]|nr:peptidase dimerization protein [Ectothiorhodospiraceae bacterium]